MTWQAALDITSAWRVEVTRTVQRGGGIESCCVDMQCRFSSRNPRQRHAYAIIKRAKPPRYNVDARQTLTRSRITFATIHGTIMSSSPRHDIDRLHEWLYATMTACIDSTPTSQRDAMTLRFRSHRAE